MEAILRPTVQFWEEYSEFVLDTLIIPHMTNTLNYACLGIVEEVLEFLEPIRSKPFSEENILEGGDVLYYAMLLQCPHLDLDWSAEGLIMDDTNNCSLRTARFAKIHSHYILYMGAKDLIYVIWSVLPM